jgi:hypothetical protein
MISNGTWMTWIGLKNYNMNCNMRDYLRTQLTQLLEYCEKNRIPLADLERAMLFFKIPVKFDPTNTYRLLRTIP